MDFKGLAGGAVFAALAAMTSYGPAVAAPSLPAIALMHSTTTSATPVDWRYRTRHGHRERYWYGPRVIRHILRHL